MWMLQGIQLYWPTTFALSACKLGRRMLGPWRSVVRRSRPFLTHTLGWVGDVSVCGVCGGVWGMWGCVGYVRVCGVCEGVWGMWGRGRLRLTRRSDDATGSVSAASTSSLWVYTQNVFEDFNGVFDLSRLVMMQMPQRPSCSSRAATCSVAYGRIYKRLNVFMHGAGEQLRNRERSRSRRYRDVTEIKIEMGLPIAI